MQEAVVQTLDLKNHIPELSFGHRVHIFELSSAHAVYDGFLSRIVYVTLIDALAVSQDLNSIRYGEDLIQLVRDIDYALSLGFQLADDVHQLISLLLIQS